MCPKPQSSDAKECADCREVDKFLDFITVAEGLKKELRHSWLSNGRQESVAEHSWMMALLARILHRRLNRKVDLSRVISMILVHDIGEAITGDIPYFEESERRKNKADAERRAVTQICSILPADLESEIFSLWEEFELGETDEAKFARALDHLEVQIQHNLADLSTWEPVEYDLVYTKMDKRADHDAFLMAVVHAVRDRAEVKIDQGGGDIEALRERHRSSQTTSI